MSWLAVSRKARGFEGEDIAGKRLFRKSENDASDYIIHYGHHIWLSAFIQLL